MAIVQEVGKSEGASTWHGRITRGRVDHSRPAVPAVSQHERLLLVSVLLVVAGWVIFRLLLTLLTLD